MHIFRNIRVWFAVLGLTWTLLLLTMLLSNLEGHRESVMTFAKSEADVLIKHMTAARGWNALHGGVYVEVNEHTPPNPYLLGLVPERDIVTPQGRKLTLVNPAYMTRLINNYFNKTDKRIAHITSLNPIRPQNAADAWETRILESFEQGATEAAEITTVEGKAYMRLMRPLIVEQSCLQCHASQGYKVGDIRGGITASVPFEKHATYLQKLNISDSVTYGLIWLLGLGGMFFGYKRLSKGEMDLKQAAENIHILSSSVEQASEAIIITDKNGLIEYVNPSFVRLTGYDKDEVAGRSAAILKSEAHDEQFYQSIRQALAAGGSWQGRIVNKKKDAGCYPAMLAISPIKNEAGEITHFVGSQQDLREYEQMEEQFHQAQKMDALGTLVGGIAHDFNNALAGITGNLYLAKKLIPHVPDAVSRLETIETLSYRSAGMIQQLLTFARKDVKHMNPIAISSFLKESVKLYQASLEENINLAIQVADSDMHIRGDINQLQQVIMNLINNARDAVAGVKDPAIRIKLEPFEADAQFVHRYPGAKVRKYACISVADNGCGIKPDCMEHVFEPFFSTKEVGKGTGLGLAMVHGAVQLLQYGFYHRLDIHRLLKSDS